MAAHDATGFVDLLDGKPGAFKGRHVVGRDQVPQQGAELPLRVVGVGLPLSQGPDPIPLMGGQGDQGIGEALCPPTIRQRGPSMTEPQEMVEDVGVRLER